MDKTAALRNVSLIVLLAVTSCEMAKAEVVYRFSGAFYAPWGWNLPVHAFPEGTTYSATVTFNPDGVGTNHPDLSYYTVYRNAATSLTFLINGHTFSAFSGNVVTGVTPEGRHYFGFQSFRSFSGTLDGLPVNDAYLALRDYSGVANPAGSITSDLSGFVPVLIQSNAAIQFGNASATVQSVGGVSVLAADPESGALAAVPEIDPAGMGSILALVGGSLGVLERRRRRSA